MDNQQPATPIKAIQNDTARGLYINTMIFAIIAAIVSILLLVMVLFVPEVRVFTIGIATLEAGLIAVIVYSIVSIFEYEAMLKKKAKAGAKQLVTVDACPDYFANVMSPSSPNDVLCKNGYPSLDGRRRYFFVKQGCSSGRLDDKSCSLDPKQSTSADFSVPLANYKNREVQDLCKEINGIDGAFASVPWTDVKARCNSLALSGSLS